MLRRLLGADTPHKFFLGHKTAYNFVVSRSGGFLSLIDRGHWLDLDYIAECAQAALDAPAPTRTRKEH